MFMDFKRQYIVDELNHKIAVQLDIKTFEQIENLLENFALYRLMEQKNEEEVLGLDDAKNFYSALKTNAN